MGKAKREHFSPEQKLGIVREHLINKVPVSDLCEKHGIQPSLFYSWQKSLFENGPAFDRKKSKYNENQQLKKSVEKISLLENRLREKDAVLADLMWEHVQLKKSINGEN